jgi:hypothetical protein
VAAQIPNIARDHGAKAIERLIALMDSKNESVAIRVEYLPPKLSVKSGESACSNRYLWLPERHIAVD